MKDQDAFLNLNKFTLAPRIKIVPKDTINELLNRENAVQKSINEAKVAADDAFEKLIGNLPENQKDNLRKKKEEADALQQIQSGKPQVDPSLGDRLNSTGPEIGSGGSPEQVAAGKLMAIGNAQRQAERTGKIATGTLPGQMKDRSYSYGGAFGTDTASPLVNLRDKLTKEYMAASREAGHEPDPNVLEIGAGSASTADTAEVMKGAAIDTAMAAAAMYKAPGTRTIQPVTGQSPARVASAEKAAKNTAMFDVGPFGFEGKPSVPGFEKTPESSINLPKIPPTEGKAISVYDWSPKPSNPAWYGELTGKERQPVRPTPGIVKKAAATLVAGAAGTSGVSPESPTQAMPKVELVSQEAMAPTGTSFQSRGGDATKYAISGVKELAQRIGFPTGSASRATPKVSTPDMAPKAMSTAAQTQAMATAATPSALPQASTPTPAPSEPKTETPPSTAIVPYAPAARRVYSTGQPTKAAKTIGNSTAATGQSTQTAPVTAPVLSRQQQTQQQQQQQNQSSQSTGTTPSTPGTTPPNTPGTKGTTPSDTPSGDGNNKEKPTRRWEDPDVMLRKLVGPVETEAAKAIGTVHRKRDAEDGESQFHHSRMYIIPTSDAMSYRRSNYAQSHGIPESSDEVKNGNSISKAIQNSVKNYLNSKSFK
jgi:hypothetical protein